MFGRMCLVGRDVVVDCDDGDGNDNKYSNNDGNNDGIATFCSSCAHVLFLLVIFLQLLLLFLYPMFYSYTCL